MRALLLLPLLATPAVPQEPSGTRAALEAASSAAREAWDALVRASRAGNEGTGELAAFRLRADGLRRDGVQTNEFEFDYAYLAPDCIRFGLGPGREVGRYGLRADEYWLKTKDGYQDIRGRDYAEDRRQVQRMHALARNFIALSDPMSLRIEKLEMLPGTPPDLPDVLARNAKLMPWLRIVSPDFALTESTAGAERDFVVELALQTAGEDVGLPRYAVIREAEGTPAASAPQVVRLDRFETRGAFRIPTWIFVHPLDRSLGDAITKNRWAQEVYVIEADLGAALTIEDFKPR